METTDKSDKKKPLYYELYCGEDDLKNMLVWFNYMKKHIDHVGIIGQTHYDTSIKIRKRLLDD